MRTRLPLVCWSDGEPTGGAGPDGGGGAPLVTPPSTVPATGQDPAGTPPAGESAEALKARIATLELDLKETRKEAAGYRTRLREAEARLGSVQELEARVKDLEPQAKSLEERLKAYEERETKRIAEMTATWPENLKELVASAASVEEQAALVERLKPTVEALGKTAPPAGNGPDPKPAGNAAEKVTPPRPVRL